MKALISIFIVVFGLQLFAQTEAIKYLPVQDSGRVKPYDTFAREALRMIYGRHSFKGKVATDVILTWMMIPEYWEQVDIINIPHSGLRDYLKLENNRKLYRPAEIFMNERTPLLFQELRAQEQKNDKMDLFYQEAQKLENQLTLFRAISTGLAIRVLPSEDPNGVWTSVAELQGPAREEFNKIIKTFASVAAQVTNGESLSKQKKSEVAAEVKSSVEDFKQFANYPDTVDMNKVSIEVFYNDVDVFQWSWVLYLFAGLFLLIPWLSKEPKPFFLKAGFGLAVSAFMLHTLGFAIRIYLIGRPPVSNMYETVLWVPWGTVFFAFILEYVYRRKIILIAACFMSVLCLILSGLSPGVLDPSLQPLQPVLRSTFWLATHVLVITISYGAFMLSWGIGNFILTAYLINAEKYKKQIQQSSVAVYRANQIGVVLLAAGIILGGVWADYSWGRFWGWDPKETWALIALLGYLAVLHARMTRWIGIFGHAAWSVVSFSLVVMAWYGVNYVLGAGLHSYGFGAGGVEWVSALVVFQLLFVFYVYLQKVYKKPKQLKN